MATSNQVTLISRKLALIIANNNYSQSHNRLETSINNANDLSILLKKIHFHVTIFCDSDTEIMVMITNFAKIIKDGDLVLFYYAGQSYQVKDRNYLIPVRDEAIDTDRDVEDMATNVDRLLERLVERNPSNATICILDCSSSYSLKNTRKSKSSGKGLHEMKAPIGAFIQFACASNQTVGDAQDVNRSCLFAKHLLKNIAQVNIDIRDLFRGIANAVYQESNQQQKPLSMNGLPTQRQIYLYEKSMPPKDDLTTKKYLSDIPLSTEEKHYYDDCKEYYHLTKEPLISVAPEVFDNETQLTTTSIKFGIDQNCNEFNLREFLNKICEKIKLNISDIAVKQIQSGSAILEAEICNKFEAKEKKFYLKMIYGLLTERIKKEFARMKVFFMFMGPIKSLLKIQKHRTELRLNPAFNRIYSPGYNYWEGPIRDGRDRGNNPYYCPIGWQRWSLYVTENFDRKFKGWSICYHGTKFAYGLSILLSGLKPADTDAHGSGIYATPSVNYAAHPRYAEVKLIESSHGEKFFKSGRYVQFVLECRVHPRNIKKVDRETLNASNTLIDSNIANNIIEWVIDNSNKEIVDFSDPDSSIICTGLLTRITDEHPGLLPESQWWYKSHVCNNPECCLLGIGLNSLQRLRQNGELCNIIYV